MQKDWRLAWGEYIHEPDQGIAKIKDFPITDMIPAMVLVWLTSYAWTAWITLLFGISIHFCIKFQHGWGDKKHLLHVHDKTQKVVLKQLVLL